MPIEIGDIRLYTTLELSQKLDITIMTLRRYIQQGKIKGQKVGGKWYVSEDSLREFFGGQAAIK